MPKVPAYNRSLNLVKGEPDRKKIKPTTIDRTKYQSALDKPLEGGDNFVTSDLNALTPAQLEPMGFNYYSGTVKGKDAIYKKGNNYYMYNEKPSVDGGGSAYGFVNIGDLSEPKAPIQDTVVTPKVMPVDPMKVEGFNGMLNTEVQQFKSGGKVKRQVPKYGDGTTGIGVVPKNNLDTQSQGQSIVTTGEAPSISISAPETNAYQESIANANAKNAKKQARQAKIASATKMGGNALLGYSSQVYQEPEDFTMSETERANEKKLEGTIDATAASVTPWYGAAKGLSNMGRKQLRKDEYGNVEDKQQRAYDEWMKPQHEHMIDDYKREGVGGVAKEIFTGASNMRAVSNLLGKGDKTQGFWGKLNKYSGETYKRGKQNDSSNIQINAENQAIMDAYNKDTEAVKKMKMAEAMAARNAGDTSFQSSIVIPKAPTLKENITPYAIEKGYSGPSKKERQQQLIAQTEVDPNSNRKGGLLGKALGSIGMRGMADGGMVKGAGTAKSDSINAKVEEGSFIVPAENAPIAKELAAKVLRKVPSKKANLNQKGQTDVRLSDGEYLFSPSEKEELIANGIDLEALAPNAKDDLINHLKCGGDVKGYAKGGGVKGGDKDRKPIEVSDPNDPRLKAYGDSLTLNKWSEGNLKDVKAGKYTPESWVASINKGTIQDKKADAAYARLSDLNKESPSPIKREEFYNGDIGVNLYKRPTQPVVLKKKESVDYLSPKSMSISESEDILPQRNYGKIQEAPKTTTEIVTTPNYQIKYTKDSTGKIIGEKYYNFDGNEISPDMQQFKSGGEVKRQVPSYKDGTDKKGVPPSNKKAGEMVEAKKAQDLKDRQSLLQKEKILKANLEINPKDYFSQAALKDVSSKIAKYNSIYGEPVIQFGSEETIDYMGGDKKRSKPPTANQVAIATGQKQASSKKAEAKAKAAVDNSSLAFDPTDVTDDVSVRPTSSTERQSTINANEAIDPTLQTKTPEQVTHLSGAYTAPTPDKKKFDYEGMLGSALNYGIPALQTGLGLRALKKAGDRPVDSLSPEYLATIAKTSGDVEAARQQAKYGFTGEQLAQAKMENNALTNSGRAFARNVAGGSGAVGLNAERAVLNDAFSRALSTRVQDKNLQLQKQQDAFNRQQGLNAMIADKQDRLRTFFNDKIGGWNQNQQSGAALVGAGLQNLVGAQRYEQEKNAAKGREALANSWSTGLTK